MESNDTPTAPARYGPAGRDPAERPRGEKPWIRTEAMFATWAVLYANADPSGMEEADLAAATRAEAAYAAEGYVFSGTTYGPHDTIENTDVEGNPLDTHVFGGRCDGTYGDLQNLVWTNEAVLENDLAAGKRPYHFDGTEYLLDATEEEARWLPACWWRLIEHGAWKSSDFDDDEDEERWGFECARDVLGTLFDAGWTPVRRLGNGYIERNERFRGYTGALTLYVVRRNRERLQAPPIERDMDE